MIKKTFQRIRLFFHPKKGSYFVFYKMLGFFPNNIDYYEEALLHKSSSKELQNKGYRNNERLEFLGDAVLDAIIADLVYHKFRNQSEGFLTNTRSKIVKRETLDQIAQKLGLDKVLVSSLRINTQKNHILGNALEAFIGAIYLDKGYGVAKKFVFKEIIIPYINLDLLAKEEANFKSKLLEWAQKHKVNLSFNVIESFKDGENNPVFQSQVTLNGLLAGMGTGYSKKESQQQAAQMALKKINRGRNFVEQIKMVEQEHEIPEPETNSNSLTLNLLNIEDDANSL